MKRIEPYTGFEQGPIRPPMEPVHLQSLDSIIKRFI